MPLTLYKTFEWQTFASLCLFTCLVYVSTYCVPIAHLRQNKPFPLLYLGHAQIKIVVPSTALLYSATKRAVAWVGSLQPVGTVPLGTWNFRNFKPEFLLNGKRPTSFTYKKDQRGLDGKANDLMLALKT